MKNHFTISVFRSCVLGCCLTGVAAAEPAAGLPSESSGTATFDTSTNVPGITVHGKSDAVKARLQMQLGADGILIERVEAWMPVNTLTTGMGLRDEHMRKYVFTTPDGHAPDVRFVGQNVKCPVEAGREVRCKVPGTLSIRGVERPFEVSLKVRQDGDAVPVFKAAGEATVKLSQFGIERPSQLGVKTEDEVKLHLTFTARPNSAMAASGGRR